MKKNIILLFFLLGAKMVFGQSRLSQSSFLPSPNAASLGIYGSIDVSPFTGLPNIGIDVFSLKQGDIQVNARLSYFAGGVKTEAHPGWVGQNWTLNVGGVITRKQNGGIDEVAISNMTDDAASDYYYHNDLLNTSNSPSPTSGTNWASNGFINYYFPNNAETLYTLHDFSPDEFFFTLPNGVSGSFFLGDDGTWKVKSKQAGHLKVAVDTKSNYILKGYPYAPNFPQTQIKRIIYKFTVTDQDGMVYVFGNVDEAVEFIRGPKTISATNNEDIIANSWYLTQITSPKGDVVNFVYERRENQCVENIDYTKTTATYNNNSYKSNTLTDSKNGQLITPSYLTGINSTSFSVVFGIDVTTELKCNYDTDAFAGFLYDDISYYDRPLDNVDKDLLKYSKPKWYQLNYIQIFDKNSTRRQSINFNYTADLNKRLFLTDFSRQSTGSDHGFSNKYSFLYNDQITLPGYNALQSDRWGYYNHTIFPLNSSLSNDDIYHKLDVNSSYTQAGILKQITYPTGGSTSFVYEPNNYSSYLQKTTSGVSLISGSGSGGGLRIASITDDDGRGGQYTKGYDYTAASTGLSSGILAGNKQVVISATIGSPTIATVTSVSNSTTSDLDYTNGSDIVYSEVKETLPDGSYNIYNYSNSDNLSYRDEIPVNLYSDAWAGTADDAGHNASASYTSSGVFPVIAHTSRELERGQLLSKKTYSATNKLIYEQDNQYRDDSGRFDEYVRSWDNSTATVRGGDGFTSYLEANERYFQAIKIYTYFPYLKSSTETVWDTNGLNPVATTKNYVYDTSNRLLTQETFNNSKAEEVKTTYHYPVNMLSADPTGVYQNMVNINQISPVIEKTTFKNSTQVNFERTNYSTFNSSMYLPINVETQTDPTITPDPRVHYLYDATGNVQSEIKYNGPTTSYKWGYDGQYPVVQASNAPANDIFYESFEEGNGNLSDSKTGRFSFNGAYSKALSGLDAGNYTLTYWLKSAGIWTLVTTPVSVIGSTYTIAISSAQIDDVRFYPAASQLTTYTYTPLVGVISTTDAKNEITFFEYDGYNRLLNVKDKDGNIIKHMVYHYHF